MRCVQPGENDYDSSRRVSNARFDYRPRYICYCANAADVKQAIDKAKGEKLGVRIRSGGHQHEGMSSGDAVLIIDLSEIRHTPDGNVETAWIGAGARLKDVYRATLKNNRILPGGGCGDVCVGGLVQGGGWGPYSRAFGLTCDSLIGFRIVKANGEEKVVDSKNAEFKDLLWAVRGAGGGNFGVITEFLFALPDVPSPIWSFTLTWSDPSLRVSVIEEWRANFPNNKQLNLTSFCRVSGVPGVDAPVIVGGNWLGDKAPLEAHLPQLLPEMYSKCTKKEFVPVPKTAAPEQRLAFHHPEYQPGPPPAALRALQASAEEPPKDTCDGGWYPHKVSSCFPVEWFSKESTQVIDDYLQQTRPEPDARRYLSLHCLGGKVRNYGDTSSCFPFRNKPFMLQYQAWWGDRKDHALGRRCLAWIRGFRETMKAHTEGAFINFPDKDLLLRGQDTLEGRKKLLTYYYSNNLERLIKVKKKYDEENFFNFEMSIPTR